MLVTTNPRPGGMKEMRMGTTITINGSTTVIHGNATNVVIRNGVISVGGNVVATDLQGVVKVEWQGPLASVQCDAAVQCGDVHGSVESGNSTTCANVTGDVRAGNSVHCGKVGGSVRAGNKVYHK